MIISIFGRKINYCSTITYYVYASLGSRPQRFLTSLVRANCFKWSTLQKVTAENFHLTEKPFLKVEALSLRTFYKSFSIGKQVNMTPRATEKFSPVIFHNKSPTQLATEGINTEHGIIGTHDGTFHCDEVTACVMLTLLPQYSDAVIVRTRDEKLLSEFDIVVDVGAVYDPDRKRYDHHQRSFNECMNSLDAAYPWVTKLSSAGLVYFHYGRELLGSLLKLPTDSEEVKCIFRKIYEYFMEEIDGIDNGIDAYHKTPRYSITSNLSSRIKHLNPSWNSDACEQLRFADACRLVREELLDRIFFYHDVWWPAREIVQNGILGRFEVDSSGEILELKQTGCPWKDHLLTLEEELNLPGKIKFVLYTDNVGNWRVQTVPVEKDSFNSRVSLKKDWWGVRNEQLDQVSGIKGCIFVHANGFIGGNKEREGALKMAIESLKAFESEISTT